MGDLAPCPRCGGSFDLYLLRCLSPACGLEGVGAQPLAPRPTPRARPRPRPAGGAVRWARSSREWRYAVPFLPPRAVSQNARVHWSKRSKATRAYRRTVTDYLLTLDRPAEPLPLSEVTVTGFICYAHVPPPTDESRRSEDVANLLGDCKALLDALQPWTSTADADLPGAGIIVSDHRRHMRIGGVAIVEVDTFTDERIEIVVRELLPIPVVE